MAGIVDFVPIQTSDRDLQLIQNELSRCIGQFSTNDLLTGRIIRVSFAKVDTDVAVTHGFGSAKVSWLIGGLSLPAIVFAGATATSKTQVFLRCEQLPGVSASNTISTSNPLVAYVYPFLVS